MSAPIYTPFFIHPNQKKRITRKRNVTLQPEESYIASYDTRSRRPTSSGGEWSNESMQVMSSHQTSKKRSHDSLEESLSSQRQTHKIEESDNGPNDVAAEVEVNVEDDIGDTEPPTYRNSMETKSDKSIAQRTPQQQLFSSDEPLTGIHASTQSQHPPNSLRAQQLPSPAMSTGSVPSKQFDPDTCTDVTELRHRLYAAYDRIEQLGRANICINRLKHDNNVMKTELNKCTYRISQLESIVLERNLRLKQLLSENVLMSARMKRIQSEFGVDAVKEIFNRDKE